MVDMSRDRKRNRKIARTMLRLKHSLNADDEIDIYLAAEEEALLRGEVLRLDVEDFVKEL